MVARRAPHILCFAPYTDWSLHSARQVTILQALRQRGATVTYVTCDGVFSDCDLLQASTGAPAQRPRNACLFCQARVATRLAGWGMPFRWLGQWLSARDRTDAAAWVGGLKPHDYPTARLGAWDVGAWVLSSVHRHFRHNVLDLEDPAVAAVFGSYLYSGVLACRALERILDEETPDAQLLFNGRMAPTRVALELAKARGIRTICEERGYLAGHIQLYDNVSCVDFSDLSELWRQWRDVPLAGDEIEAVAAALEDRWHGRSTELTVFSARLQSADATLKRLGLDPRRPVWALFSSSLDETADRHRHDEIFIDQPEWIDATVAFVARRPDLQLAIRVHPNVGSGKSLGRNTQDIAYFADLARRLPPNVRLVASDDPTSSYDLAMAAEVGLVWFSTIGVEMAAMGRNVVRVGAGPLLNADFLCAPQSKSGYDGLLESLASPGADLADTARLIGAWRFAHLFFIRRTIDFPLVRQPNWFAGEMAYADTAALAPGRDAALDRICEIFLSGAALHEVPAPRSADMAVAERQQILARVAPYQRPQRIS